MQSPVALDPRLRWSSPVSFPLLATLLMKLAANMTTFMILLRRWHADILLIWMLRMLVTQGNHYAPSASEHPTGRVLSETLPGG